MGKEEFASLFREVVERAIRNAESKLERSIPRNVQFLLNGWGPDDPAMNEGEALDELFISEHSFYRVIDVGVIRFSDQKVSIVVHRSGHAPSEFDKTWNDPKGLGPFKQIIFDKIEFHPN